RLRLSSSVYSLLFLMILPQPRSTLFPYTTLFRSSGQRTSSPSEAGSRTRSINSDTRTNSSSKGKLMKLPRRQFLHLAAGAAALPDRKSTRLNSSHQIISYAVFCLKKKKRKKNQTN